MAKSRKPAAKANKSAKSAASKAAAAAKAKTTAASASAADKVTDAAKDTGSKVASTVTDAKAEAAKVVEAKASGDAVKSDPVKAVADKPKDSKPVTSKSVEPAKSAAAAVKETKTSDAPKTDVKDTPIRNDAPKAAAVTATPTQEPKRRSVFLPLVLGGVIAGGIGYAVSEYDLLGTRGEAKSYDADIAGLSEQLGTQDARLATLEGVEPVVTDLDPITSQLGELSTKIDDINTRLEGIESQPITGGGTVADVAAYQAELKALQASAEAQRAEIQGLIDNARSVEEATADAAQTAALQASLTEITTAIGTGQPFDAALAKMQENGLSDVPAGLSDVASDGVATLNNLQTRFADSARASLSAARSSAEVEPEAGLGGFLKRQLGARSVAPKEGSDPDAILSRVEAAVRDGQLTQALGELDGLPADAQAAMQDWLDDARARQAAEAAAQDLSNSLTAK